MDTGQERIEDDETLAGEMEGPEKICGGQVWDTRGDYEQMEAFNFAIKSSCELGFEKVWFTLFVPVEKCLKLMFDWIFLISVETCQFLLFSLYIFKEYFPSFFSTMRGLMLTSPQLASFHRC